MTPDPQRLLLMLDVEAQLLAARNTRELAFVAVNDLRALLAYRQAVFWSSAKGLLAMSGLSEIDPHGAAGQWFAAALRSLDGAGRTTAPIGPQALPKDLAADWSQWLPAAAVHVPCGGHALLIGRDAPFSAAEVAVLERLAVALRAKLGAANRTASRRWLGGVARRKGWVAAAAAVGLGFLPVTGSVLAPADVVPIAPAVVRSPADGVIDRFHVTPNMRVDKGQPLFDLDTTVLTGKLEVARKEQATAEAEARQAAQAQLFDVKAKAQVGILKSRAEEKTADVRWLEARLEQARITAPRAGLAVFDDATDWIGRPVSVGERVLFVAEETESEIEAWVGVADIGWVQRDAHVSVFLNVAPNQPVAARVTTVAFEAAARPDGSLAHRVRARLDDEATRPRIGLKGTARIDGERTPLAWLLLRKPVSVVRQRLGL